MVLVQICYYVSMICMIYNCTALTRLSLSITKRPYIAKILSQGTRMGKTYSIVLQYNTGVSN